MRATGKYHPNGEPEIAPKETVKLIAHFGKTLAIYHTHYPHTNHHYIEVYEDNEFMRIFPISEDTDPVEYFKTEVLLSLPKLKWGDANQMLSKPLCKTCQGPMSGEYTYLCYTCYWTSGIQGI